MTKILFCFIFNLSVWSVLFVHGVVQARDGSVRIVQLLKDESAIRRYPDALPSLLKMMNEQTNASFDTDPLYISTLTDERLNENPILYINCDEQPVTIYV